MFPEEESKSLEWCSRQATESQALWWCWPSPRGRQPLWLHLIANELSGGQPSHQQHLFLQAALVDLTLVFLASEALRSFSSLGLAVFFSFETVWELNLNLINNI